MARTIILGRAGSGKSWFGGYVLEKVLTGEDGERLTECDCDEHDCDHVPGDDDFVLPVRTTDDGVPTFGDDEAAFSNAIHIDLEDEERGFSDPDDPVLLTYTATQDNIDKALNFKQQPSYIPDAEWKEGPVVPLPKWVYYKNRYVRVVPDGLTDQEKVVLVEMFADAAMKTGDCHFSLDEAHLVAEKHAIGDKLMRLVTGGRKRGVEWLFITQRPQNIHEDILSQTDYTVYFNLRDNDRDKAAEKSSAIPNAEGEIEDLPPRTAIIEDFDAGEYHKFSTEGLNRDIEHVSGDDGKADAAYESLFDES